MIIPVKCYTCGKVLADKYRWYQQQVSEIKSKNAQDNEEITYLTNTNTKKTPEGKVLDKLKLTNLCCRRHMLTHVDIL